MKWLVSTVYSNWYNAVADISMKNHREYCNIHGYEYNVHFCNYKLGRTCDNADFYFVLDVLKSYDAIMTLDLDCLFMNMNITLDSIFPDGEQQIARENVGGWAINNGVMLWRNCESSRKLLQHLINTKPEWTKDIWSWQRVINELIGSGHDLVKNTKVVSWEVMNGFGCHNRCTSSWKEGEFLAHFLMAGTGQKVELMTAIQNKIKRPEGSFYHGIPSDQVENWHYAKVSG